MKKKVWIGLLVVFAFVLGYFSHKPKTIIQTIIQKEEVKVYDFTQEPQMMEIYANTMNKVLIDKDEFEKKEKELRFKQLSIWEEGYKQGYSTKRK